MQHPDEIVDEAEISAMRRYHYDALVDSESTEDDNEYYI